MNFLSWLFTTRAGVGCLFLGGILLFLVIAFVLEQRSRKLYYNHERSDAEDEGLLGGLFDDDVVEKAEAEAAAQKGKKR